MKWNGHREGSLTLSIEWHRELIRQEENSPCNTKGGDWCLYVNQCTNMGDKGVVYTQGECFIQ